MSASNTSETATWQITLTVPKALAPGAEAVLEGLGGAMVTSHEGEARQIDQERQPAVSAGSRVVAAVDQEAAEIEHWKVALAFRHPVARGHLRHGRRVHRCTQALA